MNKKCKKGIIAIQLPCRSLAKWKLNRYNVHLFVLPSVATNTDTYRYCTRQASLALQQLAVFFLILKQLEGFIGLLVGAQGVLDGATLIIIGRNDVVDQ